MSVSLTESEIKLFGNGSTTIWPLGFAVPDANNLQVALWEADGSHSLLTLNVDYSVTGNSITAPLLGSPYASGQYLYVKRVSPLTQQLDGSTFNELNSEQVSGQFDLVALQIQELNSRVERSLRMAVDQVTAFPPTPNALFGTDALGRATLLTTGAPSLTVVSGSIVWETSSVSSFIADTDLDYGAGAVVQVAPGDLIRAGGFRYAVLGAATTPYDLANANGVRVAALDIVSEAFGPGGIGLQTFYTAAKALGSGIFSAGLASLSAITVAGVNLLSLRGVISTIFSKAAGVTNLLTFTSPTDLRLEGVSLTGNYSVNGDDGHGLVLVDAERCGISDLYITGFGGTSVGNGGAGVLAYPANGSSFLDKNYYSGISVTGGGSQKDFGIILASARYNIMLGCQAHTTTNYGLEYKNNSLHNVMSSCVGSYSRYSFGTGYEGSHYSEHNVYGLLNSHDSDIGFLWAHAKNNVLVGLVADADSQPDTFGDGNCYGLHIEAGSDQNLALGVMTSGTAMDYPLRIRGSRNAVQLADYSSAAKTVTINAAATENYVEILHIGAKATTVTGLIEDQNTPIVPKGPGANVYDSPLTRQYFGSIRDAFTWGLDGLTKAYAHFSTTGFRYEGNAGQTVLGLGVEAGKEAGLRVATSAVGDEGAFTYQNSATPYWRWDVDQTQNMRLDVQALSPVTAQALDLGKTTLPWGDAFIKGLRMVPPATAPAMNNGDLVILAISNTQIRLSYKGSDGTTRSTTLTLS